MRRFLTWWDLTLLAVMAGRVVLGRVGRARGEAAGSPHHQRDPLGRVGGLPQLSVARAVARRPPVILADEPTGNLDSATGAQIVDLLVEQNRSLGSTLVPVPPAPSLAAHADRAITLRDGRVTADAAAGNGSRA